MPHDDQKYIVALLKNDEVLIKEMYERCARKIKWMVLQNNGSESDAEDIFQDALMSLYKKAKTEQFILTCPIDNFLLLICKNKWLNELEKRKVRGVTIPDVPGLSFTEEDHKLAEQVSVREERHVLLEEMISKLDEKCRQVLKRRWEGKSMERVAEEMHYTYAYARKKKSECMEKLIDLMKQSSKFDSLKW